jgi:hypothetical protein
VLCCAVLCCAVPCRACQPLTRRSPGVPLLCVPSHAVSRPELAAACAALADAAAVRTAGPVSAAAQRALEADVVADVVESLT